VFKFLFKQVRVPLNILLKNSSSSEYYEKIALNGIQMKHLLFQTISHRMAPQEHRRRKRKLNRLLEQHPGQKARLGPNLLLGQLPLDLLVRLLPDQSVPLHDQLVLHRCPWTAPPPVPIWKTSQVRAEYMFEWYKFCVCVRYEGVAKKRPF